MKLLLLPDPWWLPAILAAVLFIDAMLSIRPPKFIHDCLSGVGFPRDWWWALIGIKVLAAAGLVVGLHTEGVGLAAVTGVIAYFLMASYAHIRARFVGTAFWVNCLGMLAFSCAILPISYIG
ncbi:DoxX family protein [Streptomyces sp. ISL-98]|uniref:DoxX family protein n=1 Tax=Streptomyces sp. ISL-98 TaxID=2819192 RepID=UPI001BE8C917|nr:DoxX family protein [Streptomyces sp. ISL-98]MBT2509708.1 DoxX family protein [Streptomyces sp. ISL-98]